MTSRVRRRSMRSPILHAHIGPGALGLGFVVPFSHGAGLSPVLIGRSSGEVFQALKRLDRFERHVLEGASDEYSGFRLLELDEHGDIVAALSQDDRPLLLT